MEKSLPGLVMVSIIVVWWVVMASPAAGQIPPGYEVVNITNDAVDDGYARMNNCGEVVFGKDLPGDLLGVFLYDNGKTIQVSVDGDFNTVPDINDHGVIVWTSWEDETAPAEIVMYDDGVITHLTDDPMDNDGPRVNNLGHVVWTRWFGDGCGGARANIMFYDGTTIEQLTDDEFTKQAGWINENDDLVWDWSDFCVSPWEGEIMLWVDRETTQITTVEVQPQVPAINNHRVVVWDAVDGIDVWEDGEATQLTDQGDVPSINDDGEILFHWWNDDEQTRHIWWYRDGEFYQLTDGPISNTAREINEYGEAVWWIWEPGDTDVGMLRRLRNGDVDLDFDVDADDLASFPECMTGPVETNHLCDCRFFDVDHDRDVDMEDFLFFQTNFTGPN